MTCRQITPPLNTWKQKYLSILYSDSKNVSSATRLNWQVLLINHNFFSPWYMGSTSCSSCCLFCPAPFHAPIVHFSALAPKWPYSVDGAIKPYKTNKTKHIVRAIMNGHRFSGITFFYFQSDLPIFFACLPKPFCLNWDLNHLLLRWECEKLFKKSKQREGLH